MELKNVYKKLAEKYQIDVIKSACLFAELNALESIIAEGHALKDHDQVIQHVVNISYRIKKVSLKQAMQLDSIIERIDKVMGGIVDAIIIDLNVMYKESQKFIEAIVEYYEAYCQAKIPDLNFFERKVASTLGVDFESIQLQAARHYNRLKDCLDKVGVSSEKEYNSCHFFSLDSVSSKDPSPAGSPAPLPPL